ncbi:hypothetical protein SEA_YEET_54 [Mycobacterium phage Yeet]|uniref:Uncharacterized protein n=3 Tax=Omegavirus TaxID=1623292 RepID=A0A3S9UAS6_9CAUD|nr:hypothetical protein [Acinetobacter baumannii]YP_008410211.1 hypothetical protein N860_gp053 [Mycobacterium phage Redno2]YP_009124015.1 hypothetical protein VC71_gp062 [Mycobacterium phage Minerva]YP_009590917.1 hypothetical protein FDG54_gp061 [Mycobacterium phage Optimus]YP_009636231.1 hypothetical protein FGG20_gp060 [Mycobacterium phage Baka]ATN88864.1 hypothetical protein SEA_DMPSTRDIVER_55 [Mycobacterium phage DmpstrDiver]ATN89771.1 hypothetical protein SEA_KLEIN_56 [Mycobacterium ph
MTAKDAIALIAARMDAGWYYEWHLCYNSLIDWTGHPGEAK